MKKTISIKNGVITTINDDRLTARLQEALGIKPENIYRKRVSHVEPTKYGTKWEADMGPAGGPLLTGFTTRQEALDAEIEWLNAYERKQIQIAAPVRIYNRIRAAIRNVIKTF